MTEENKEFTNRLLGESSPYLLQHAHNPVDWHPWDDEALALARQEDKPILLSIGYSACHWCHVMAHESFENPEIARLMNELFVNIKVDREERPDLDEIYMLAVQLMTGSGGWPMTVFLTPQLEPFLGGTYFPPEDRMGMPGFPTVLNAAASMYRDDGSQAADNARQVMDQIKKITRLEPSNDALSGAPLEAAFESLLQHFDSRNGGFGTAPKFPSPMSLRLLLTHWADTADPRALNMVEKSLDAMASGGIYDHLGGGFHRYSVDAQWQIPHFEKMLYDNALLVPAYLDAYRVTQNEIYANVARETLDYVLREMTGPKGGFYATQDADTTEGEGAFFAWTPESVRAVLGKADGDRFCQAYGVSDGGNFEHGLSVLHLENRAAGAEPSLEPLREQLLEERDQRLRPGTDKKVLAAWNGLMLSAMSAGWQVLEDDRYRSAARQTGRFILERMMHNGRLLRTHMNGESKLNGYLEDYAFLGQGLLDVYESTFEPVWIEQAIALADRMLEQFYDPEEGGFYFTASDHEKLFHRDKNSSDGAIPSGGSVAVQLLLKLAALTGRERYRDAATRTLQLFQGPMLANPGAYTEMIRGLHLALHRPREIVVAGPKRGAFLKSVYQTFGRHQVLAACGSEGPSPELAQAVPLLAGKSAVDGKSAVYICQNFTCTEPITDPSKLPEALL